MTRTQIFRMGRQGPVPQMVLVTWYGSFAGHGTIGDFHAMRSVVMHLVAGGHRVFHASAEDYEIPGAERVDWQACAPGRFHVLLFVCGPILKDHAETPRLFDRFRGLCKVGVGVSLFEPGSPNHMDPFNYVLAREGKGAACEDVAILSALDARAVKRAAGGNGGICIGLVLRGMQAEYGVENCQWKKVNTSVSEIADTLIGRHGGRIIRIENHLGRSGLSPDDYAAQYGSCDLIISTRFHGAMLALQQSVPFIAIDQITGGAKVSKLIGRSGWPHCFRVDDLDKRQLMRSAEALLAGRDAELLRKVRRSTVQRANATLARLDGVLEDIGGRGNVAC